MLEMAYSYPRALRAELFIDVVERLQLRGIVKFESLLLLPLRESMESQPGSAAVAESHRRSYYVIAGCRGTSVDDAGQPFIILPSFIRKACQQ